MNRREIVHLKQLRIFQNSSYTCLMKEVNDFITNNKVKISDIQYSTTGGGFFYPPRYSVMVVIEEDEV